MLSIKQFTKKLFKGFQEEVKVDWKNIFNYDISHFANYIYKKADDEGLQTRGSSIQLKTNPKICAYYHFSDRFVWLQFDNDKHLTENDIDTIKEMYKVYKEFVEYFENAKKENKRKRYEAEAEKENRLKKILEKL